MTSEVFKASKASSSNYFDELPDKPVVNKKALEAAMNSPQPGRLVRKYDVILITVLTIFFYSLSFFLYKVKAITIAVHRKIWNMILLFMAFVSLLGGLLIVLQLNYSFGMKWFNELMFWHVEAGIAMTVITVFHFWWHRKYFLKFFN
jgi:hypothetical protein